ncbi:hypothetical protein [Microseira wollei]|uniref:Uncharacterized protein n=1 Tax=Microseira wollei NIES-4236 TaxID=2530354 RepID=A0AAV3XA55_9CYAN|nr:hypothetical protein [Microseira wollei]GET39109.1 hypothetical protein MiSe_38730 [Microseira wollei NIES-4236]
MVHPLVAASIPAPKLGKKEWAIPQSGTFIKNRRTDDNSRFTEERNDGKLSRSVLESSGGGDSFTDFNYPAQRIVDNRLYHKYAQEAAKLKLVERWRST